MFLKRLVLYYWLKPTPSLFQTSFLLLTLTRTPLFFYLLLSFLITFFKHMVTKFLIEFQSKHTLPFPSEHFSPPMFQFPSNPRPCFASRTDILLLSLPPSTSLLYHCHSLGHSELDVRMQQNSHFPSLSGKPSAQ